MSDICPVCKVGHLSFSDSFIDRTGEQFILYTCSNCDAEFQHCINCIDETDPSEEGFEERQADKELYDNDEPPPSRSEPPLPPEIW